MFGIGTTTQDQGQVAPEPVVVAPSPQPPGLGSATPAQVQPSSGISTTDAINAAIESLGGTPPQTTPVAAPVTPTPPTPQAPPQPQPVSTVPPGTTDVSHDDLYGIKQSALTELTPLVGHLEGTPEEQFDAYMMMIRSTDDARLIPPAYEVAKQITDEKRRAKALLDIVNEVNYLTQKN